MFEFNFPIEEEESSFPQDITSNLHEEVRKYFQSMKTKLLSTNLEYLIQNIDNLIQNNIKDNYVVFGNFYYYSPRILKYNSKNKMPEIEIQIDENPAIIIYKKTPLLMYLTQELMSQIPQIVYKSHSRISKNDLMPTIITNPIFSINLDPQTNQLIPLNLISVDEVNLLTETTYFPNYDSNNY